MKLQDILKKYNNKNTKQITLVVNKKAAKQKNIDIDVLLRRELKL